LEASLQTVGIAKVSIRGTAKLDGFFEHGPDLSKEPAPLILRQIGDNARRENPRPEERFAPVDVTDPGDDVLLE
jgi:hypothetical protein